MHIIYTASTCSDRVYRMLFSGVEEKPAFQSQKYHRLLIEGLAKHVRVDVVANAPVNAGVMDQAFVWLPRETEGGAEYRHMTAVRNNQIRMFWTLASSFFRTFFLCRKDSVVVVDILNRMASLAGMCAAKLRRRPCVGIVMDLPDMMVGGKLLKAIPNYVMDNCTHFLFLTEAMNTYVNHADKPYVVLEGHADAAMLEKIPDLDRKAAPRRVLYAGGVYEQYGLKYLVEGFRNADIPNAQLDIYGPGDYVEELQKISAEDPRIFYGGMLMNSEIVEKEQQAALLVNPRPTHEEYVKYSFPSKTMEYMASGTPVLTTRLPGMPAEYEPHVYFIEEENAAGVEKALKEVLRLDDGVLFEKGSAARKFVLEERNNVVQAKKILDMLEGV